MINNKTKYTNISKIQLYFSNINCSNNNYISDETLCHSCNVREYRLSQINNIYKPELSRDNFMNGDNPINGLLNIVK
jgi:hypothetical protein